MKQAKLVRYIVGIVLCAVVGTVWSLVAHDSVLPGLPFGLFAGLAVSLMWDLLTKSAAGHLDEIEPYQGPSNARTDGPTGGPTDED